MAKKFYVTTAIDYVNARPHIGHAFEKVLADALVRWRKLKGDKVFFLTGTDENAQKNAIAAKEKGIPVKKFVDENSNLFIQLCKKLNVGYDDFIRTTEERHKKVAQEIFKKVYNKGEIYKGNYKGLYCEGCEAFLTERNLVNGKCPEHNKKPTQLSEEAYFFKLSKYRNRLIKFVENYIVPNSRKKEILSRLKNEELRDLCVSRTGLDWGIDSPVDKKFKIYVWFDALINYVSGANGNWPADVHVVGKGINWFHSVIWPAILLSIGYELPKKLIVHGYLNLKGQKISKSLGNIIDPIELVEKYGADAVRYSLLRCSVFDDSDYSEEILIKRYNGELANKLGNLVSRVAGLIEKIGVEKTENKLIKKLKLKQAEKFFENYEFDKALNTIFAFIDVCNEYVQSKKLWETKNKKDLFELKESILKIAELLLPFIPKSAEKIKKQFSAKRIKKGEVLFKKIKNV
ncbi:methionine--tRNA ligase [Candidatus Pacearchaeota archaeon]|nr:methionine--tRNA ligase [Candidatus Pacearchaeota archaeon]